MDVFGRHLRLSLFGESHGPAVGMTLDGVPAGIPWDLRRLKHDLAQRRPGQPLTSGRKESDEPEVLSGVGARATLGTPITMTWRNEDAKPSGEDRHDVPRPGHADYPLSVASSGQADLRGGGHASGRLTVGLVAAGAVAQTVLDGWGIRVGAHLHGVGGLSGAGYPSVDAMDQAPAPLWTAHRRQAAGFLRLVEGARSAGDSVGGVVAFAAEGLPVGIGSPFFDGIDATLAHLLFSIPAVKAVEFGHGVAAAGMRGWSHNDSYVHDESGFRPASNHAGGLLGGRTSGLPLLGRATVKPTSSIAATQQTARRSAQGAVPLAIRSRNDPCIAIRAVPVVRACVRLALADAALGACASGVLAPWWTASSRRTTSAKRARGSRKS